MSSITRFGGPLARELSDSVFAQHVFNQYDMSSDEGVCVLCDLEGARDFWRGDYVHPACHETVKSSIMGFNRRVSWLFDGDGSRINEAFQNAVFAVKAHTHTSIFTYCINNGVRKLAKLFCSVGYQGALHGTED